MAFLKPRVWTESELAKSAAQAVDEFASSRRTEGISYYMIAFDDAATEVNSLLEKTDELNNLEAKATELFSDGKLREVRYLSSPAISEDDLKTISGLNSTSRTALSDEFNARLAIEVIRENLDTKRFPWMGESRLPTEEERNTAVVSTAALIAGQETQTKRRNLAKELQESAVAEYLKSLGYREVRRRHIRIVADAPKRGEYCRECKVSGKKADLVVGLADGRFMALECKVSNSEVNSFKRLNHETVEKVQHWNYAFGANGVVGAAVLAGVFKVANLKDAQEEGVSLFWSFDLTPLGAFLNDVANSTD